MEMDGLNQDITKVPGILQSQWNGEQCELAYQTIWHVTSMMHQCDFIVMPNDGKCCLYSRVKYRRLSIHSIMVLFFYGIEKIIL